MYLPAACTWLALAIRYRSLTVPLLVNPGISLSGMVGSSKAQVLQLAAASCGDIILPWFAYQVSNHSPAQQAAAIIEQAQQMAIQLPLVCKPDTGCRGSGVTLIHDHAQLTRVVASYPAKAHILIQALSDYEPEAGIFFVRDPRKNKGWIPSLTCKETPTVIGNGQSTLAQLVAADPRAAQLSHLYEPRNSHHWQRVVPAGCKHRLLFSASHCRGAVFRDARNHITPALTEAMNRLLADIPGFHYGRLDVKFKDLASLRAGEHLQIIEINGASSESIHIWDAGCSLGTAMTTLCWQISQLFQLGARQRQYGRRPPSLLQFWRAWQRERHLSRFHPATD